jgi:hypothetical protein
MAAKSADFLLHSCLCVLHQLVIRAIPQLVMMGKPALHATASRLENVFAYHLGVEWRELAVPVDALAVRVADGQ